MVRYRKRSRSRRSRRYSRRTPRKTRVVARKALRLARRLARNIETKFHQTSDDALLVGKNIIDTLRYPLHEITLGTRDESQRIGDSISVRNFFHKFTLYLVNNGAVGDYPPQWTTVRYYVALIPRTTDPSDPGIDVVKFFENNNTDRLAPLGWKQWDRRHLFRLLYSKVYTLDTFHPSKTYYHRIKINKRIQYDANTNNILKWDLVYGFVGSWAETTVGISNVRVSQVARMTYQDS